jgi:hypothetical protein
VLGAPNGRQRWSSSLRKVIALDAGIPLLSLIPVAAALVVVLARGGDWRAVLRLRLRHLWLVWAAVGLQIVSHADPAWAAVALRPLHGLWPVLLIWLLAVAFAATNLRALPAPARPALVLLAVGFTLNSPAMAPNGGMPFSVPAARLAGLSDDTIGQPLPGHTPLNPHSWLAPLADVIPLPGLHRVLSAGDLAMLGGLGWLLAAFVLAAPARQAHETTKGGDRRDQLQA